MADRQIAPPVSVELDIPVTRRTKLHAVTDGAGNQVFHSRRLTDVFDFLLDNGVLVFDILDEDAEFRIVLSRPLSPLPLTKG